jgi:hypothetical protein
MPLERANNVWLDKLRDCSMERVVYEDAGGYFGANDEREQGGLVS